jgi:hypothetical protein
MGHAAATAAAHPDGNFSHSLCNSAALQRPLLARWRHAFVGGEIALGLQDKGLRVIGVGMTAGDQWHWDDAGTAGMETSAHFRYTVE